MKKKTITALSLLIILLLNSCASIQVLSDYDTNTNFNTYQSYAFYKTGIDKVQISDLDKKRILRAIETEFSNKGFIKSKKPDILISIFTKEREQINIYNNYWGAGFGWGWNPYFWGSSNTVSARTEGSLYIDIIDATNKELVWQGKGVGTLGNNKTIEKKEMRIKEFVSEILKAYPPNNVTTK